VPNIEDLSVRIHATSVVGPPTDDTPNTVNTLPVMLDKKEASRHWKETVSFLYYALLHTAQMLKKMVDELEII
jgi:hypothetical protein